MAWKVHQAEIADWLSEFGQDRFHGVIADPPYALISIAKRFAPGNAAAQEGADGRYSRLSSGFMGQRWDGFDSLEHYQDWVAEWAGLLIESALLPGAVALFFGGTRTFHHLGMGLERGGFEIIDTIMWLHGQGFPKAHKIAEGYYTALKPAWEPIYLCRAPRDRSFKKLMAEHGTGGLNIDGSRIEAEPYTINTFDEGAKPFGDAEGEAFTSRQETKGRWPANVIVDDSILGEWTRYFYCAKASKKEKNVGLDDFYWQRIDNGFERIDAGQYERLEDADRARGNIHPTIKPLDLCRYLANLIRPPMEVKSRLLVPFSGTGSEMIGGIQANWGRVEGIEMEANYTEMAEARIEANIGML